MMFITDDIAYVDRDVYQCEFMLIPYTGMAIEHMLWIDADATEKTIEEIGRAWYASNWQGPELISIGLYQYEFQPFEEEDLFWDVNIAILFKDRTWDADHYIVLAQTENAAKAIALAEAISHSRTLPNPEFCEWFFIMSANPNEDLDDDEKAWIKGE